MSSDAMNPFKTVQVNVSDKGLAKDPNAKFKTTQGGMHRLSIAHFPIIEKDGRKFLNMNAAALFTTAPAEWNDRAKAKVVHYSDEITQLVGGARPEDRFATVVVEWPLDPDTGEIDEVLVERGRVKVLPYEMGTTHYNMYKKQERQFPFGKHDLILDIADNKFRTITLTPANREPANRLRALMAATDPQSVALFDKIVSEVESIVPTLGRFIGKVFTPDELRERLGIKSADAGYNNLVDTGSTDTVNDLLSNANIT